MGFEGRKCPKCQRFALKKAGTDHWKIWSCSNCGEVFERDRLFRPPAETAEPMP